MSHGLVDGAPANRASDEAVRSCIQLVENTAAALGFLLRIRCAASTATGSHHLNVVAGMSNNVWSFRRGLDGADMVLLEELATLTERVAQPVTRRSNPSSHHADLVLLVGQDRIYAPAVRQLRLLGVPTWVLNPGRYISADLFTSACAFTPISRILSA